MSYDCADRLREHGLKATIQRLAILEAVSDAGHIGVDDLFKEVSKHHPSFSLSTVYKNIEGMQEAGIIVEVPVAGGKKKYEVLKEDHVHLICQTCGTIIDKPLSEEVKAVIDNMTKYGFEHRKSSINLYGTCDSCQHTS